MNKTRDLYFNLKYDTTYYGNEKIDFQYLEMKEEIKGFYSLKNNELKSQIQNEINRENEGLFYKDFYICFTYNKERYYIKHHHETNNFINKIVKILKKHKATNILVKYGELD